MSIIILNELLTFIILEDVQSAIVFVREKRIVDWIATCLSENDFPATSIHGDRKQAERQQALTHFKTNKMKIIVVTSIGCKGLGIYQNPYFTLNG